VRGDQRGVPAADVTDTDDGKTNGWGSSCDKMLF